jgi:hypothetical protein
MKPTELAPVFLVVPFALAALACPTRPIDMDAGSGGHAGTGFAGAGGAGGVGGAVDGHAGGIAGSGGTAGSGVAGAGGAAAGAGGGAAGAGGGAAGAGGGSAGAPGATAGLPKHPWRADSRIFDDAHESDIHIGSRRAARNR